MIIEDENILLKQIMIRALYLVEPGQRIRTLPWYDEPQTVHNLKLHFCTNKIQNRSLSISINFDYAYQICNWNKQKLLLNKQDSTVLHGSISPAPFPWFDHLHLQPIPSSTSVKNASDQIGVTITYSLENSMHYPCAQIIPLHLYHTLMLNFLV
jgi:hypothetical protein